MGNVANHQWNTFNIFYNNIIYNTAINPIVKAEHEEDIDQWKLEYFVLYASDILI